MRKKLASKGALKAENSTPPEQMHPVATPPPDCRDEAAFGKWFLNCAWPRLRPICISYRIYQQVDIENVLQDVACNAWPAFGKGTFEDERKLLAWLKTFTRRACAKWWRETYRQGVIRLVAELPDQANYRATEEQEQEEERKWILYQERAALVSEIIDGLPDELRRVVRLRTREKYQWSEVAQVLGVKEETARNRFRKALRLIRREIRQQAERVDE